MASSSPHVRSLREAPVQHESDAGSIRRLTKESFPILERISIKRLVIEPGCVREPHWHANADELPSGLAGDVLVSVLDNADVFGAFTIGAGEMFHIDSGSLHHIENVGEAAAELLVVFSDSSPRDFSLHGSFRAMSDAVLGNAYGLPAADLAKLPRDTGSPDIVRRVGAAIVPDTAGFPDPHKFSVEAVAPALDYPFGNARLARVQAWPALRHLSMYSLRVETSGMREPHCLPETAGPGYVPAGKARMRTLDPDGSIETYYVEAGDVYFVPRAYPHQTGATGDGPSHFC